MSQRKKLAVAEMKVGILVTVALFLLGLLILQQSWGIEWFAQNVKAMTYLSDVGGLKPGAPVWLAGIEIGKVRRVTIVPPEVYSGNEPISRQIAGVKRQIDALDPKQPNYTKVQADLLDQIRDMKLGLRFVEVQLDIRKQYLTRISKDSEVTIESRGLIGDSFIEISAGTYGDPPIKRGEFYLIESARTAGFREIMTGANDVIANFGVLSDQFKNIALKINPDKVGAGLTETIQDTQKTLKQAERAFSEATRLVSDIRKGDGTLGRFVSDPALYNQLNETLDRFEQLASQIQQGSGTLSKLINDPALFDSMTNVIRRAEIVVDRIDKGEGTLGRLSKDAALYDSTRRAIEKFASFVDQIDQGNGTMGKLIKDPSLYNNLDQSTSEITKLIYDLRQDPKKYLTIRFRLF